MMPTKSAEASLSISVRVLFSCLSSIIAGAGDSKISSASVGAGSEEGTGSSVFSLSASISGLKSDNIFKSLFAAAGSPCGWTSLWDAAGVEGLAAGNGQFRHLGPVQRRRSGC